MQKGCFLVIALYLLGKIKTTKLCFVVFMGSKGSKMCSQESLQIQSTYSISTSCLLKIRERERSLQPQLLKELFIYIRFCQLNQGLLGSMFFHQESILLGTLRHVLQQIGKLVLYVLTQQRNDLHPCHRFLRHE